jgi:hypothetical protein
MHPMLQGRMLGVVYICLTGPCAPPVRTADEKSLNE